MRGPSRDGAVEIELREGGGDDLVGHADIPIRFLVDRVLSPRADGSGFELEILEPGDRWVKDYDGEDGASPARWSERFDTALWRVVSAWRGTERIGGVVLIADVPGIDMLEGRSDLALIWDLRVAPAYRRCGVGARLISAAGEWARRHGCRELKVETQNINVPAVRFYESRGFRIRSVVRNAYPGLPDELQLMLYRDVDPE